MRVGIALMIGTVIGGSMSPQGIAYAQAGASFELSPALPAPGRGPTAYITRSSRTPQRIAFRSALIPEIVAFAYGFPLDRVERRPQWMYDNRYNVAVTTTAPTGLPQQKLLLQQLLQERFALVVRRLSYEGWVYFLVPGPKVTLTPAQENDAADIPRFDRIPWLSTDPVPGKFVSEARHASMSDLAIWLSAELQSPVLDKTGITGFFDFEIPGLPPQHAADGTIQAVRNALGLDLERRHGTAETLIIDHSEAPVLN